MQTLSKPLLSRHAKGSRMGGWQIFWCLFSFVVHKVRDTTGRKVNRGRQGNDRGGGEGRRLTHHSCFWNHKPPATQATLGSALCDKTRR